MGGFLIAKTVRINQSELTRFFLGPKCFWPLYLGIVTATFGWANALAAFRKAHWGWHAFQMAAMLIVFSYTLSMWIKVRRYARRQARSSGRSVSRGPEA